MFISNYMNIEGLKCHKISQHIGITVYHTAQGQTKVFSFSQKET